MKSKTKIAEAWCFSCGRQVRVAQKNGKPTMEAYCPKCGKTALIGYDPKLPKKRSLKRLDKE